MVAESAEQSLAHSVEESESLRIEGMNSFDGFRLGSSGAPLSLRSYAGIVEHLPDDMVVSVRAGTSLAELQAELGRKGQCLPLHLPEGFPQGTLGGAISMAMPHPLEAEFGSWRDWVLGLKLLLADGTVVKCGSRAVKNVAGYDIQKLIVGARGSLAIILEAILRTAPIRAIETFPASLVKGESGSLKCVQRTSRADFRTALEASRSIALFACSESATLWLSSDPVQRFPGDWIMAAGIEKKTLEIRSPERIRLMHRAKAIFDPGNKLNPGEWEFL